MPKKELPGATLLYPAADAETAEAVEALYEKGSRILKDHWGLTPPPEFRIDVATSWLHWNSFDRAVGPVTLYLLPWLWYEFSFCGTWAKAYVNGGRLSQSRGAMRVKSLRHLPDDDVPPMLQASWSSDPESDWDQRRAWKLWVGHTLTRVFLPQRTPAWLIDGIGGHVGSDLIDEPWRLPKDWGPILRWAGHVPQRLWSNDLGDLPQEETDEFVAKASWPRWVARYLRDRHFDVLREILAFDADVLMVQARTEQLLHDRLGLPKDPLWSELTLRAVYHYGGPEATADLITSTAAVSPASEAPVRANDEDNPYRAPTYNVAPPYDYQQSSLISRAAQWTFVVLAIVFLAFGVLVLSPIAKDIAALRWVAAATGGIMLAWILYRTHFSRTTQTSRVRRWLSYGLSIIYAVPGFVLMRLEWVTTLAVYVFSVLASVLVGFWLVQVMYVLLLVTVDLVLRTHRK